MIWLTGAGVLLGAALAAAIYRPVVGLLAAAGAVRPNYAGRAVPVGGGLVFVLATLAAHTVQWLLAEAVPGCAYSGRLWLAGAPALLGFAFLGILDDLLGSRETGGFAGHFRLLLREGRLTSGALKALGGGVVAVWPAWVAAWTEGTLARRPLGFVLAAAWLNWLVISLTANAVNLLDLRPGRALKGFLLVGLAAVALGQPGGLVPVWLAPLAGAALVFGLHDLRGEIMMGDTGSNVLGALVGVGVAWSWSLGARAAWLLFLVAFHFYTERASLSAAIERVSVLRWLDRLGRSTEGKDGAA
ncbi:MAG TPA: hypothetical protein GXX28_12615 [Firmicutes bacterium]|nr:hypothetical protein [Bacillota bacterium]